MLVLGAINQSDGERTTTDLLGFLIKTFAIFYNHL